MNIYQILYAIGSLQWKLRSGMSYYQSSSPQSFALQHFPNYKELIKLHNSTSWTKWWEYDNHQNKNEWWKHKKFEKVIVVYKLDNILV